MAKKRKAEEYLAMPVCGNCRDWHRLKDSKQLPAEDVRGECWWEPPRVFGIDELGETQQALPDVPARHACGQHRPKMN